MATYEVTIERTESFTIEADEPEGAVYLAFEYAGIEDDLPESITAHSNETLRHTVVELT